MEELLKPLMGYGLPGLTVAIVALYVWRVKVPSDQKREELSQAASNKRDAFIEQLVVDGEKNSQALVAAFRDDIGKRDDKFLKGLIDVEASHRAGVHEIVEALRERRTT